MSYNTVYKKMLEDEKITPTPTESNVVTAYNAMLTSDQKTVNNGFTQGGAVDTFNASVGTNGAPKTYDQFVSEGGAGAESIAYQNWLNSYNAAEAERKRATNAATAMYDKSRQTYGAMAEQLRASGMQGAGYSDYLDSKAYATMGSQIASANATSEASKRQAEATAIGEYAKIAEQNRLEEKAKADEIFNQYLKDKSNVSTLTKEYIDSLDAAVAAGKYGESYAEEIKALWNDSRNKSITSTLASAAAADDAEYEGIRTSIAGEDSDIMKNYIESTEFSKLINDGVNLARLNQMFPTYNAVTRAAGEKIAEIIIDADTTPKSLKVENPEGYVIPSGSVMDYAIGTLFTKYREDHKGYAGPLKFTDKFGNVYYQRGDIFGIYILNKA